MAVDKGEGSVKGKVVLGSAGAPLFCQRMLCNHFSVEARSTNDRFGHNCNHDSSMRTSRLYGMRERPINSTVKLAPTGTTRGLLSMRTISGYGFSVRSIQ